MSRRTRGTAGFTLIEMVVVLAIIGTLAIVVGPSILRNVGDANVTAAKSQIEILSTALDAYHLDTGGFPSTEDGLAALRVKPSDAPAGWRGPYLKKSVPPDPWGRAYVYRAPGTQNPESYDLYTLGRDGRIGGSGEDADITSWGDPIKP